MNQRERIDAAAKRYEEGRAALYRRDGSKVYGEEAHAERANARRAFVSDDVYGLSADALADRTRAVISSGDRPAMFLYAHHLRAKANGTVFGPQEQLRLRELASELELALDPDGAARRERVRAELEEARRVKDYVYYRRYGARDPVELHMNRVYGTA